MAATSLAFGKRVAMLPQPIHVSRHVDSAGLIVQSLNFRNVARLSRIAGRIARCVVDELMRICVGHARASTRTRSPKSLPAFCSGTQSPVYLSIFHSISVRAV